MITRFWIVLTFAMCGAALARAGDPFTVADVPVDARGATAIEAQTDAILRGQTRAAAVLVERLTYADDRAAANYVPPLPDEATRMIRAMSVANERRSADRYIGDITVAFVPAAVRAFANARGLTLLETQARERVVLLVPSAPLADESAFSKQWSDPALGFSLTPLRMVAMDPTALAALDTRAIKAGDPEALAQLRAAVGASEILLAEQVGSQAQLFDIETNAGTVHALGTVADARTALRRLESEWKQANSSLVAAADSGTRVAFQTTVLFDDLGEWLRLQEAIDGAARVTDVRLNALASSGALMTLTYVGEREALSRELRGKGVRLDTHPRFGTVMTRPGYDFARFEKMEITTENEQEALEPDTVEPAEG